MSESSSSPAPHRPPNNAWITFAHELDLPDANSFSSHPPRMPLDVMLNYCEELLQHRSLPQILAQPDRVKGPIEFEL